jgi:hypothetical protein
MRVMFHFGPEPISSFIDRQLILSTFEARDPRKSFISNGPQRHP